MRFRAVEGLKTQNIRCQKLDGIRAASQLQLSTERGTAAAAATGFVRTAALAKWSAAAWLGSGLLGAKFQNSIVSEAKCHKMSIVWSKRYLRVTFSPALFQRFGGILR